MKQLNFFENQEQDYEKLHLDKNHHIVIYRQIDIFRLNPKAFDQLWNEHPEEYHEIVMHGKKVKTPRWQQAYGKNYEYTGSRNNALPLSKIDKTYLEWCKANIDDRLNGLLINWYDGKAKHYMGKHRDSPKGLIQGSPIVTISHGGERIFRMRPHQGQGFIDRKVQNGDVLIIPWTTNQKFTHEVPHFTKYNNRRISVTLRAFK